MKELADVLDSTGNPTGLQKTKDEIFRSGDWRVVTHVWIVNPATKELVIQKRVKKGIFDDLWDVSVGGGVQAGEPTISAASREVEEELGLRLPEADFELIGRFKIPKFIPEKQLPTNEFSDTYLVRRAVAVDELTLQAEEVAAVRLITLERLRLVINDPENYERWVPHSARYYNEVADRIEEML